MMLKKCVTQISATVKQAFSSTQISDGRCSNCEQILPEIPEEYSQCPGVAVCKRCTACKAHSQITRRPCALSPVTLAATSISHDARRLF